jgi:hypothetical protein
VTRASAGVGAASSPRIGDVGGEQGKGNGGDSQSVHGEQHYRCLPASYAEAVQPLN